MDSDTQLMIILALILGGYFIPTIIAHRKSHPNKSAIIALNILAGWTFAGWLVSFIWSLTNPHLAVDQQKASCEPQHLKEINNVQKQERKSSPISEKEAHHKPVEDDNFSLIDKDPFMEEEHLEERTLAVKTIPWMGGTYSGQLDNNKPSGQGTLKMPNNVCYEGHWKDGKPCGFGKMSYSSGAEYTGCFSEGRRHGFGVYCKEDGTKFIGEWDSGEYLKKNKQLLYKYLYSIVYEGVNSISALAEKFDIRESEALNNLQKIISSGWLSNAEISSDRKHIIVPGLQHKTEMPEDILFDGQDIVETASASQRIKKI